MEKVVRASEFTDVNSVAAVKQTKMQTAHSLSDYKVRQQRLF